MIFDTSVPEKAKVSLALGIWFGDEIPKGVDLGEVIDAMLDFYRCGKVDTGTGEESEQLFSYTHDYDLIFAAFLSEYGIDLLDPGTRLHWWRFRAMLAALPSECQLMQVIGYRAAKIPAKCDPEYRRHLLKMKRAYALPTEASAAAVRIRSEDDYRAALEAVLAAKREMTE